MSKLQRKNVFFRLQRCYTTIPVQRKKLWTDQNTVISPCKDIDVPSTTIVNYVWENLEKWPTKIATICGITNRSYTYEQMYTRSRAFSANLRKKVGIENNDVVSVMLPNMPEYPQVVFGILGAGGVVSTINPIYTEHEVCRQMKISESKLIIASSETIPVVKAALNLLQKNMKIIIVNIDKPVPEGAVSFEELAGDINVDVSILKDVKRNVNDVCYLPYSSGTTGLPKGVELTNKNIIANCLQQSMELRQIEYTTDSYQESVMAVLPMFHSYGLSMILTHKLSAGCKLVVLPSFKPDTFLDAMLQHRVSLLCAAPPMVLFLGSHPSVTQRHLDSVNTILCGAAPTPYTDIEKIFERANRDLDFIHAYGLTESSPLATANPRSSKNYTAVGVALASEQLRIVDENQQVLGPNELGELQIKGPNIMKGYKDNPEATKAAFADDEWLRSGDQAKIDEHGFVTIADRIKELIKVKGFQVPPAELEAVLKEHPSVLDAAVIGVPDPKTGERPRGFVVLHKDSKTDASEIQEFINKRVAHYKKIQHIDILESIPKNPSGKILRRVLKEEFCK